MPMPAPSACATVKLAGTECTFETGRIARQAHGALLARCGDDVVLATVVAAPSARPGVDFLPLTVEYREKLAAAGRIPGSFTRREGRITDHEVLTSRLIDRTIRSLFPETFQCEVQVQVSVLSADPAGDPTSLALLAATGALQLSSVPAAGPAAGLRIVQHGGRWHPFALAHQRDEAELDFVVSAGPGGLLMVEGEAREVAEELVIDALEQAQQWIEKVRRAFAAMAEQVGNAAGKTAPPAAPSLPALDPDVGEELRAALAIKIKSERHAAVRAVRARATAATPEERHALVSKALDRAQSELVREAILRDGARLDGRGPADIRPIWGEVGWLPRPHGSAIFTRGETQALVSCTLGTGDDAQRLEGLGGYRQQHFLLHYGFPPYSVGEVRPLRGPGRREIGHGMLARRGLTPVVPSFDDFPYTLRVESEISESNGSSSMATVCGATMAMLHAGVPLRAPVAGIAMGLVTDGRRTAVLSDILGDEDHLGDMDFKVVGTAAGITALQLDNKVGGLQREQLAAALEQAAAGRRHILAAMAEVIAEPAAEPSPHAPRVLKTAIMPSAIGSLVGPRGANIRAIESSTETRVATGDDGLVRVYGADGRRAARALAMVHQAAGVLRVGGCYRATITGIKSFGAFAKVNDVNEGLIPTEELGEPRVAEGEEVVIAVLGTDGRGRLRLSHRRAEGVDEARIEF